MLIILLLTLSWEQQQPMNVMLGLFWMDLRQERVWMMTVWILSEYSQPKLHLVLVSSVLLMLVELLFLQLLL